MALLMALIECIPVVILIVESLGSDDETALCSVDGGIYDMLKESALE